MNVERDDKIRLLLAMLASWMMGSFIAATFLYTGSVNAEDSPMASATPRAHSDNHAKIRGDSNYNADNTARNTLDENRNSLTALDQSNEVQHLKVTSAIRREILRPNNFSSYAENIKIITTSDRRVTLKGPVASAQELNSLVALAKRVAPDYVVINELEVATQG